MVIFAIFVPSAGTDGLYRIVPCGDEAPFETVERGLRFDLFVRPGSGPEGWICFCEFEEVFVDAALVGGLAAAGEEGFYQVPA